MVDDGSTDGTPELLARFAGRITVDSLGRTRCLGGTESRHGARAGRATRVSRRRRPPSPALSGAIRRGCSRCPSDGGLPLRLAWNRLRRGRVLYGQDRPFDLDWDPFHALAAAGSPPISALAVRRTAATRVGPFDETESSQADWDYWLRLAASGAPFQGVPGNVAIIRRRNDSMSALAGTQLAVAGLAVLERHLSRHQRCPACIYSDAGLRSWRQAVLRSSARDFARRLHLEGPHWTADRRGRRGRVSTASRFHGVAGATRETTHRLSDCVRRDRSGGAAVCQCGGGGKVAESLSSEAARLACSEETEWPETRKYGSR